MNILKTSKLSLKKANKNILNNINISISKGEIIALIGPNGSGKSSLLRTLAAIDLSYLGKIFLNDKNQKNYSLKARSKLISWSPTYTFCPFPLSVYDFIMIGRFPWNQGIPNSKDHKKIKNILQLTSTAHLAKQFFNLLSDGEKKRVLLGRALAQQAPIMIFDEICANLDIAQASKIFIILNNLAQEGRTIFVSTHNLYLAKKYTHKSIILSKGNLIDFGKSSLIITQEKIYKAFGLEEVIPKSTKSDLSPFL